MPFLPIHDDNPRRWISTPYVGWGVILFCVILFIWQTSLGPRQEMQLMFGFGFIPAVAFDLASLGPHLAILPAELTAFTSIFLHGGAWHLIGNMLFLYIFGDNVEDNCGHVRFALFFLLTGAAASFAHGFSDIGSGAPLVGASGAISGILGAYLLLKPTARITALMPFFLPVRLPVWMWVGGWFVYQAIASGGLVGAENVAYFAHIGGFAAGVALIPFFKRRDARLFARS